MRARAGLSLALVLAVLAPAAAQASPLRTGFLDGGFVGADAPTLLGEAKALGAGMVRLPESWGAIAPQRPATPADPADPAYRFGKLDTAVRGAVAAGLEPLVAITTAPAWVEGPGRPASSFADPGAWRPDPAAFAPFGRALARRYDGTFPDPARPGARLPRVAAFQLWNEPNLEKYLAPQWRRSGGRFVLDAAPRYRRMVTAFSQGVHAAQRFARVVTGGTGPFGDRTPGGSRTQPVAFWREVLCLTGKLRRKRSCTPASFDVLAHHPYSVGGPTRRALNRDDVSVPDLGKLVRVLRRAEARRAVRPLGRRHPVWVTEVSWDSAPPDPDGVPSATFTRWVAEALYVLWRQGVGTVLWFQVRDAAPVPSYATTNQSGMLLRDGRPKPAAAAFRLPLVATPGRVWLRAPAAGTVAVQVRDGAAWRTLKEVRLPAGDARRVAVGVRRGQLVRAVAGSVTSPEVRVRAKL